METTITSRNEQPDCYSPSPHESAPQKIERERERERERTYVCLSNNLPSCPPLVLPTLPCPYLPISVPLSTHQVPPHRLRCLLRQRGRDRRGVRGNLHGRYATRTPLGNQLSSHLEHTLVASTHTTPPPLPRLRTMLLAPRLPPPRLPKPPPQERSP